MASTPQGAGPDGGRSRRRATGGRHPLAALLVATRLIALPPVAGRLLVGRLLVGRLLVGRLLVGRFLLGRLLVGLLLIGQLLVGRSAVAAPPPPVAWEDEGWARDAAPDAHAPPRLAPDPDSPVRPFWVDTDDYAYQAGTGAQSVCELAARPLLLIPGFGGPAYYAAEWACVLPGALTVDYFQSYHGGRDVALYEAGIALALAKLVRDLGRLPVVLSYASLAFTTVTVATLALLTGGLGFLPVEIPDDYRPIALTGLLTSQALIATVFDALRIVAADGVYTATLGLLSDVEEDREAQIQAQETALLPADLGAASRLWALSAVSVGTRPAFSLWHLVPVAGRILWAYDASETLKERLRRLSKDTLREDRENFFLMDLAIYSIYAVDAGVAITKDALLVVGFGVWGLGTAAFLAQPWLDPGGSGPGRQLYGQGVALLGATGVALASAAVVFVVLQDAKQWVAPWLIPLAYGPLPPSYVEAAVELLPDGVVEAQKDVSDAVLDTVPDGFSGLPGAVRESLPEHGDAVDAVGEAVGEAVGDLVEEEPAAASQPAFAPVEEQPSPTDQGPGPAEEVPATDAPAQDEPAEDAPAEDARPSSDAGVEDG